MCSSPDEHWSSIHDWALVKGAAVDAHVQTFAVFLDMGFRYAGWTYSCWVAQTNLKLGILLPWSPKGWDPGRRPIYLASLYMFLCEQMLLILLHECPGTESGSNGSSQFKVLKSCQAILTSRFAILHSSRKMCGGFESWPLARFPCGHHL